MKKNKKQEDGLFSISKDTSYRVSYASECISDSQRKKWQKVSEELESINANTSYDIIYKQIENDAARAVKEYYDNLEKNVRYACEHYIDQPFKGDITKGRLRARGIKGEIIVSNDIPRTPLGIRQRNNLITFDGYRVPYENGTLNYDKKIKI